MAQAQINTAYPLRAQLADGNNSVYPQAVVYDAANTVVATIDLSLVGSGLYAGTYTFTATGYYTVTYTTYSDAGHTVVNATYDRTEEQVEVVSEAGTDAAIAAAVWNSSLADYLTAGSIGEALFTIRGLLQYNYVLDQTDYNNKGLLVSGRIRIFASKADADAGINPVKTLTITSVAEPVPDNNLGASLKVTVN